MKNVFLQNKVITIPTTASTSIYSTLFKADDCYKYLSGVAAIIDSNTIPDADDFEIEFRDDYRCVLSFSPFENWLKNTKSVAWNMQDTYKSLCIDAQGRNFYFNVKVTNLRSDFSFVALVKQTTECIPCKRYDQQGFNVVAPALGQAVAITLPSDYTRCKGIMISGGDDVNANYIGFDISDSKGQIVDVIPMSMLHASINMPYDVAFYPVDFESKSRQIFVRLTALANMPQQYTATNYTITFLLVE